jgi:hypothetical protein
MKTDIKKIVKENTTLFPVSFLYIEVKSSKDSTSSFKITESKIHQTKSYTIEEYYKVLNIEIPRSI